MAKWAKRDFKHRAMTEIAHNRGWHCHYCGAALRNCKEVFKLEQVLSRTWQNGQECFVSSTGDIFPTLRPTLDHKIPRSKNGDNSPENLVLCCLDCNREKSNKYSYDEFLAMKRTAKCQTLTQ